MTLESFHHKLYSVNKVSISGSMFQFAPQISCESIASVHAGHGDDYFCGSLKSDQYGKGTEKRN